MPDTTRDRILPDLLSDLADDRPSDASADEIVAMLEAMVLHPEYPCLGARSVFNRDRATIVVLEGLGTAAAGRRLQAALADFATAVDLDEGFTSLVAVFRDEGELTEPDFEKLLWQQLRHIHEADDRDWDPAVSSDPQSPHFAFSAGGTAFFVVGLHPGASRIARRSPLPTLVFNFHEQFEQLRADEQYVRMRDTIRRRDVALQGTLNPMVEDHGSRSEARQYAGRQVSDGWEPPVNPGPSVVATS
jgi:FPC/CPF motif-containing protein YcgG